jgi:hypothetical protein
MKLAAPVKLYTFTAVSNSLDIYKVCLVHVGLYIFSLHSLVLYFFLFYVHSLPARASQITFLCLKLVLKFGIVFRCLVGIIAVDVRSNRGYVLK